MISCDFGKNRIWGESGRNAKDGNDVKMREPPLQFLSRKILFLGFDISAPQQHNDR